ncbi:MAG: hypothetical protein FWG67_09145 [Defluviitaleaceae bacterium]|nr:hypothetical protein [Defluviitaleaceae bacterium]
MSKLRDDPARFVPKRVMMLSLLVTVILIIVSISMRWPLINMLSGFWVGVIVNLISFRLIVIDAHKLVNDQSQSTTGKQLLKNSGFTLRLGMYGISLFLVVQFAGIYGILAAAIGVSMVGFVLKLDAFLTVGRTKTTTKDSE